MSNLNGWGLFIPWQNNINISYIRRTRREVIALAENQFCDYTRETWKDLYRQEFRVIKINVAIQEGF